MFRSEFERFLFVCLFTGYTKAIIYEIEQIHPGPSSPCLQTFKITLVLQKRFIMISPTNINLIPHRIERPRSRSREQLNVSIES